MRVPSPEKIVLISAGAFMLASIGLLIGGLGFGIEGFRRWGVISFVIAAMIMSLPLLILAIILAVDRIKPNKAEDDAGQAHTCPEAK